MGVTILRSPWDRKRGPTTTQLWTPSGTRINPTWTPRRIRSAPPTIWATAKGISGIAEDGAISAWSNRIAGLGDLTQGTGTRQPVYKAAAFNGLPCVRFAPDGTRDDSLGVTFSAVSQPYWIALVGRYRAQNSSGGSIYALGGTNALLGPTATNLNAFYAGGTIVVDNPVDTDPHIWIGVFHDSVASVGENNGVVIADASLGTNTWQNFVVGASNNVNSTAGTELDAAEVLFGVGVLSDVDRVRLRRYLSREWRIPAA